MDWRAAIVVFALCTAVVTSKDVRYFKKTSENVVTKIEGYSISAPQVLTTDTPATICLTLHSVSNFDGQLHVTLINEEANDVISTLNVQAFPGKRKCFDLTVPRTSYTTATLKFSGRFGNGIYPINNNATVTIRQPPGSINIGQNYTRKELEFSIYMTVTPKIIFDDVQEIILKVCATYSNGKPVGGLLRANVTRKSSPKSAKNGEEIVFKLVQFMRDECYSTQISRDVLGLDKTELDHLNLLYINADITDKVTKVKVSDYYQVEIKRHKKGQEYSCKILDTTIANEPQNDGTFKVQIGSKGGQGGTTSDRNTLSLFCSDDTIATLQGQIAALEELSSKKCLGNPQVDDCQQQLMTALEEFKGRLDAIESKMAALEKSKTEMEVKLKSMEKEHSERVSELDKKVVQGVERMTKLEKQVENALLGFQGRADGSDKESLVYSWKIAGISQKMAQKTFETKSPVFQFGEYDLRAKANLELKGQFVSMSISFIDHKNTGKQIALKLNPPEVKYVIRDQSGNDDNRDTIAISSHFYPTLIRYGSNFVYYEKMIINKKTITQPPYVIDDTVVIDILVKTTAQQKYTKNG